MILLIEGRETVFDSSFLICCDVLYELRYNEIGRGGRRVEGGKSTCLETWNRNGK
jgi:hypothetical protein